ncbi:unnamed protein product [Chondrus crispus]|uniref:Uncharacterized protein n=1 Tax=Chondrus crispus TaxID=2769 RepID=R7Q9W6_CHOCR|nr:unnamed protein product [Chondrus crispus]CDF34196.1 unnamed protein product [Chondrus crispus]|eukprot:XP_005714015.1 unnamed protein product [Chondrus crispus]
MRKALGYDKGVNKDALRLIEEKANEDWTRNSDVMEGFFWEIVHKGVDGRPIAMNYGVDVGAEGAYKARASHMWNSTAWMIPVAWLKKRSALYALYWEIRNNPRKLKPLSRAPQPKQ